jgi:two-component system, NarL family, invasion response regulator UvrY
VRLLVVDDHAIVREGVRRLLAPEGGKPALPDLTITEAASAQQAAELHRASRFDVVLLDLNLPGGSGLELLRRLRAMDPGVRVLVLSMYAEVLYVARALEAGARGYVSKAAGAGELLAAIQKVAAGGEYVERELAAQLLALSSRGEDPLQRLTAREADIMRQLGEGRSLAAIAAALGVTYKTVANSCSVIKTKLGAERMADLIRIACEMGG